MDEADEGVEDFEPADALAPDLAVGRVRAGRLGIAVGQQLSPVGAVPIGIEEVSDAEAVGDEGDRLDARADENREDQQEYELLRAAPGHRALL